MLYSLPVSKVGVVSIPSKTVIESITMSSAGDIRGAIKALQFACRVVSKLYQFQSSQFPLRL